MDKKPKKKNVLINTGWYKLLKMSAEHLEVEYINPEKENNHINPLDVRSVRDFQYHLTEKRNDPLVSITAA
ncbi:hypothetical protein CGH99_25235, partial [Vibrio parahaemolyticus]